jgi:L-cysteine desulfidase
MRLRFPMKGIYKGSGTVAQPADTTFDCLNMRAMDIIEERMRGGQRPGWSKWGSGDQIGTAENPVVALCVVGSLR